MSDGLREQFFTDDEIRYCLANVCPAEEYEKVVQGINPLCFKRVLNKTDKQRMTEEDLVIRQKFLGKTRRFRSAQNKLTK